MKFCGFNKPHSAHRWYEHGTIQECFGTSEIVENELEALRNALTTEIRVCAARTTMLDKAKLKIASLEYQLKEASSVAGFLMNSENLMIRRAEHRISKLETGLAKLSMIDQDSDWSLRDVGSYARMTLSASGDEYAQAI